MGRVSPCLAAWLPVQRLMDTPPPPPVTYPAYNSTKNSFQYLRFMPRINVPVAEIDPSTTFFKTKTPFPVFMAPTGQTKNGHPEGELK